MCVSRDRVAWKSGFAMRLFAQPLGEASVEVAHGRDVEAVQPDHGPIGLIAVVVPLPPWSEDQIERSEEHTSELQSLMRISYAVFCLKKTNNKYERVIESL